SRRPSGACTSSRSIPPSRSWSVPAWSLRPPRAEPYAPPAAAPASTRPPSSCSPPSPQRWPSGSIRVLPCGAGSGPRTPWAPPPPGGGAVHLLLWEDEWRRWRDAMGRPLRPLAASRAEQPGRGHLLLVAPPPGRLVPAPAPRPTPPARGSEGVVDAGKDRRALAAAADVDEADDLRAHHAAEPEAVDEVQVRDRRVGHPAEHLARLDEGRQ